MKVVVTGSYPPDICGVGDYTACLLNTNISKDWKIYYSKDWSVKSFLKKIREINRLGKLSHIFVQYPTEGYRNSFLPHLIAVYYSIFTTTIGIIVLHECNTRSVKAKLILAFVLLFTNKIYFTNEFHSEKFKKKFLRLRKHSKIVKIYPNISAIANIKTIKERFIDLAIFGHIRKGKGLDSFINVARILKNDLPSINIAIIGQIPKDHSFYYNEIKERCDSIGIKIILNLSNTDVANVLNNCKLMYFPFEDGVSEKRGSFLAALRNGALICTTKGVYTTQQMEDFLYIVDNESHAVNQIKNILSLDVSILQDMQHKGQTYLDKELPHSWEDVAKQYL
jgi:glycosyltransferase involved in cell wall biosynthesis